MMKIYRAVPAAAFAVILGGCATSGSVDQKIAAAQVETSTKIESVVGQVEDLQQKQKQTDVRLDELSKESREALQRAQEAGVLAKGKVVFEQSYTEDRVKFKTASYDLDKNTQEALTEFATRTKALDTQYFVEIQGHTDDTGSAAYNDELGQRRADSVRRYLSREHQLPLNRMSTISYGDTSPVGPNKTRAGRSANRRVVLVVLE